jgi:hypothetical protein
MFFSNPKISLSILDELKESRFWGNGRNPPRLEVDDEACPDTQTHGRNRQITHQIARSIIGSKIPPKITKMKNITTQDRR